MRSIIINASNVVQNTYNDTYTYQFPVGSITFKDDQVAISQISIPYSWFNISSTLYNNNQFQYIWYNSLGSQTYTITIPDGFFDVSDINSYLQTQMVKNGHYLINSSGQYVYYLEIITNSNFYAIQLNSFPIPTSLPSGWTNPSGLTFPATASTPQFVLPTSGINALFGINAGTYPPAPQTTTYSTISSFAPQITPVQSIIVSCTLLNNKYAIPNTLLYSFTPSNVSFGSIIVNEPSQFSFVDIYDGEYTSFTISFTDQNLNRFKINDPNLVIMLTIRNKNETS